MTYLILAHLRRLLHHVGDGVRAFERRDDAFDLAQLLEAFQCLRVRGVGVFDLAEVMKLRVLRPDGG